MQDWIEMIFSDELSFDEKRKAVFEYQFAKNPVYRRFCEALSYPSAPSHLRQGSGGQDKWSGGSPPLLPVAAFKDAVVTCLPDRKPDLVFQSSGTSAMKKSLHLVADEEIYSRSLLRGFDHFYQAEPWVIWAYTPGYAENPDSSLIWMLHELMKHDETGVSCFLPLDEPLDKHKIEEVEESGRRLILFGAAFGLLDLIEIGTPELPAESIVIETGGMKTHRREIARKELHGLLAEGFGLKRDQIHSEYGMCELLSQAYATGGEWFRTVPWMEVSIRDPENPSEEMPAGEEGMVGIVDLANVHSCSFLLTGDRGVADDKGQFRVLGRWHVSDLRGCNFLIEED